MVQKFKLYQIVLDEKLSELINKEGWKCHEKALAYYNATLYDDPKLGITNKCYTHVANIIADDLEHAWEASNLGPSDRVEKLTTCHSLSVGDIVEDAKGMLWFCESMGWKEVYWHQYEEVA